MLRAPPSRGGDSKLFLKGAAPQQLSCVHEQSVKHLKSAFPGGSSSSRSPLDTEGRDVMLGEKAPAPDEKYVGVSVRFAY